VTVDRRYGVEDRRIVNAITLMEQNIERPVPMKTVASLVGISPRQFERMWLKHFNVSPSQFYLELRLRVAPIKAFVCTDLFSSTHDLPWLRVEAEVYATLRRQSAGFADGLNRLTSHQTLNWFGVEIASAGSTWISSRAGRDLCTRVNADETVSTARTPVISSPRAWRLSFDVVRQHRRADALHVPKAGPPGGEPMPPGALPSS
jgi:hypothetical protein